MREIETAHRTLLFGQVAQLAVHAICNREVASSILVLASIVLHERFLPIPFIKIKILGVYSKPNLVNKKDFYLFFK